MDTGDSSTVLEEVEALFRKLKHLPEDIRQKALSCIQEKLPDSSSPKDNVSQATPDTPSKPRPKRGPVRKTSNATTPARTPPTILKRRSKDTDATGELSRSVLIDEETPVLILEDIQTTRGRKTKRLSIAQLGKSPKRVKSSAGPASSKSKSPNSTAKQRLERSKKRPDVPSDVAESAEILASLSNEIAHQDINQGRGVSLQQNEVECLKDSTNNQTTPCEEGNDGIASLPDKELISPEVAKVCKVEIEQANEDSSSAIEDNPNTPADPLATPEEFVQDEHGDFYCKSCDSKAATLSDLTGHVCKHKENIPKTHVCHVCGKSFTQGCSLQLHLKRHRGERDFPCNECDYKAFTKVDLYRHQTIHTGERNKICEFCGKAFAKDSTLRDHVKSIHERKLQHSCELCGFVTHRANNLRVHIRMRHHGEYNNHVCPVCGASVKQKNAFLEHMRSHTGERPYKCDSCSASFACLARLNVHRNSVHGERQFKCSDCDKCFQTKHHLIRHQAIHTKERPYACPFCSYACNTQGNIAKHVRSMHQCPDFSYRKYKDMQQNGGQPREVDPEWVRKGQEVTKEYLDNLSEKLGRPITLDDLWTKEKELQKKKQEQDKVRFSVRERKARKVESPFEHSYHTKVKRRKVITKSPQGTLKEGDEVIVLNEEDCDDPVGDASTEHNSQTMYGLLSQAENIHLCLETNEVQVYTGDATRELSLIQMKNRDEASVSEEVEEVEAIRGYVNESGQFVHFQEGEIVNDNDSTVVVIIDSDMQESVCESAQEVLEVTCEEGDEVIECKDNLFTEKDEFETKRQRPVIRILKQNE